MSVTVGDVMIQCPDCPEIIEVPMEATLGVDDDRVQRLLLEPEMSDLWAHAWTHEAPAQG